ncbi:hypothetical protein NW757_013953 [Fusarium falciforme]|nr:hypothetical protein NW757_013953 [Fusarium falciforme]
MGNSSNQQNLESQRVSDLVRDFQLTTCFLAGDRTQHTVNRVSDRARHRRPSRINETWSREQELGSGGFGCVWLERCVSGPAEGKLRAVKEIRKDPSLLVSYSRELEAMARFSHKKYVHCFVECYGWYKSENTVFIAMEYIEHGDLQNYLNQPFSESHAKVIGSQLVEGLGYMHENGFAHRDLKPKQPGPDWWVKIGDFGISKRAEGTALRTEIGTEGYVAPEVIGLVPPQSSSYTVAVDMWALGALLFRMIVRRPVFPNSHDLVNHVVHRIHPFSVSTLVATGASQDCCNFVTKCMAADPKCHLKASEAALHPWIPTWRPPSPPSGRSSTRGCEVPPPIPTRVPICPGTSTPQPMVHLEDTAPWSTVSQEPQQAHAHAQHVRQEPKELLRASRNGHVEVVQALLKKGADIMAADKDKVTPLHLASWKGYVEVVKALLEKGVDFTVASKDGSTPLHLASRNGHFAVVQALQSQTRTE